MRDSLQKEVLGLTEKLKSDGKINLARQIEENWDKTCLEYSKELNTYSPDRPMEPELKDAFDEELARLDFDTTSREKILSSLEKRRILQTGPHILSPVNVPRHFFFTWLGALALKKEEYYPVAMFSGVPFSNKTRPGRICFHDTEINLVPAVMQDELVYRSVIPEKMIDTLKTAPPKVKKLLPDAKIGESYTKWAVQSSLMINEKYLRGKPVFFDFNEVVTNYLLSAVKDASHPVYKILFAEKDNKKTVEFFGKEVFFYGSAKKGKYGRMEAFYLKNKCLKSSEREIKLEPEILEEEMRNNRLCPGLPLGFLALTFLNRFKCFGSFAQTEYLPVYKKNFSEIPCLHGRAILEAPTENLTTTGAFPKNSSLRPLDLRADSNLEANEHTLFGETILAIRDTILKQNYSANMVK